MFIDKLFEPNQLDQELSPWDLYKIVDKDSKIHVLELVFGGKSTASPPPNRDRVKKKVNNIFTYL